MSGVVTLYELQGRDWEPDYAADYWYQDVYRDNVKRMRTETIWDDDLHVIMYANLEVAKEKIKELLH